MLRCKSTHFTRRCERFLVHFGTHRVRHDHCVVSRCPGYEEWQ